MKTFTTAYYGYNLVESTHSDVVVVERDGNVVDLFGSVWEARKAIRKEIGLVETATHIMWR
jgi:hypothetical protein